MAQHKIRIAYITEGLWHAAGMERVLSLRVNAMCHDLDITFITLDDGSRPDIFPLDQRIERVHLPAKTKAECYAALSAYFDQHPQDITVSTGGLESFVLYKLRDGSKKVFEFHFSFNISWVWMGQHRRGMALQIAAWMQTLRRILLARKYDQLVVLSQSDAKKWTRFVPQTTFIYNPLTIHAQALSTCEHPKAIAVGRLHYQKGFDYLIQAWQKVAQRYPQWQLDIYGEGELRQRLQQQIDEAGLSEVVTLRGATQDIVTKYVDASMFLLSSRDEAFGLVITEAEACGLPVVAFDCPSAPHELVHHGQNGFMVPLGDVDDFADKICKLIADEQLRKAFGTASVAVAAQFKIEAIQEQWMDLYHKICHHDGR